MTNEASQTPPVRTVGKKISKVLLIVFAILITLLVTVIIASFFIDEPLRRFTEKKANENLKGYTVRIPKLSFHPVTLSLTIADLTLTQDKHPVPPIARFRQIDAGIHWRSILSGMLVAEMKVDKPVLHVNLSQLREEAKEPEPVRKKKWQRVVQTLYPLKVNTFSIRNADVTYVDEELKKDIHVTNLNIGVSNIRNRASPKNQFPSPVHVDAVVFDGGKVTVDGSVNFLAEPRPTGKAVYDLQGIHLPYFKRIAARSKVDLRSGLVSVKGNVLSSPKEKVAEISELKIEKLKADYLQEGITAVTKKKGKGEALKKAEKIENKPGLLLRIGRLEMKDCELGFVNRYASPTYRVYITNLDLLLTNLSNHFSQGPAKLELNGKFMGSGATKATATFRPETDGPDFDLDLSIYGTEMKAMNNLLRAYGKFDVVAGKFSFYTQLNVKNDKVTGYVKPLFRQMQVYDRRQDKEKSLFRKLYEKLVGGVAKLLENKPREAVATVTDISGKIDKPKTNTWQAIVNILRNAFTRAILPGFEEEVRRGGRQGG